MTNRTGLAKERCIVKTGNRGAGVYKEKEGEKRESDLEINELGRGEHDGGMRDYEATNKEKISTESRGGRKNWEGCKKGRDNKM